jgi:hypothetical protein
VTINFGLFVIVAVLVLATVLAVVKIAKAPTTTARRLTDSVAEGRGARSEITGFAIRGALILMVGLLVGVSLMWLGVSVPSLMGIPAALSIGLATSAAIMTDAVLRRQALSPGTVTTASLEPRHWWTFARPRSVTMLGTLSALVILATAVWVSIGIAVPAMSPTPAGLWSYPVAIAMMVVVLTGATYFALRKSADRPINLQLGTAAPDLAVRGLSARIISGITGAVLFGYLAAIMDTIGGQLSTLGQIAGIDGSPVASLSIAGIVVRVLSAGLTACSISSLAASTAIAVSFAMRPQRNTHPAADRVAP